MPNGECRVQGNEHRQPYPPAMVWCGSSGVAEDRPRSHARHASAGSLSMPRRWTVVPFSSSIVIAYRSILPFHTERAPGFPGAPRIWTAIQLCADSIPERGFCQVALGDSRAELTMAWPFPLLFPPAPLALTTATRKSARTHSSPSASGWPDGGPPRWPRPRRSRCG